MMMTNSAADVDCVVTGCADLEPPPNARVDRYDDSVVVRCNLSHETWYLTCKGSVWIGTITNCSEGLASAAEYLILALKLQHHLQHMRRSSVNLGGKPFLLENICMQN